MFLSCLCSPGLVREGMRLLCLPEAVGGSLGSDFIERESKALAKTLETLIILPSSKLPNIW